MITVGAREQKSGERDTPQHNPLCGPAVATSQLESHSEGGKSEPLNDMAYRHTISKLPVIYTDS